MDGGTAAIGPSGPGPVLIEREAELDRLHRLLSEAGESGGRVVLVRGEAGIGKSALVSRFLAEVADRAHVLLGECDDLLTPEPLGPVRDVARDEPSLAEALAEGDRRGVIEGLLALLVRGLRPTVLVFEDVQWADEATLDVVRFLGRRIGRTQGLLVLTYRDGEVDTHHPLRLVIGALPPQNLVRIPLQGLSERAVAAMAGGRGLDVGEVSRLTGGNPLFIGEVLAWGAVGVPPSIRDSVLGRAAGLSEGARRLLDLVAVVPGGADLAVVERMLGPIASEVEECVRRGFLRTRDHAVGFRHELVRRGVESGLSDIQRRELNRRVLGALDAGADPAVLVHHAREAGDVEALVAAAPGAARAALAVEAHREALEHFRTLEPHLERLAVGEQAGLLMDWARVERYVDFGAAGDLVSRAVELYRTAGLDRDLARALTRAVRLFEMGGRPDDAGAAAAEAVEILRRFPPDRDLARAVGQQAWLALFRGDTPEAAGFADEAIGIAEAAGDEPTVIDALNTKGIARFEQGDPDGLALLEESRSRAEHHGYPEDEIRALHNMAALAADLLDLDWCQDLAQRSLAGAVRHEMPADEVWAKVILAWILVYRGRWSAAYDGFSEALASCDDPEDPDRHLQAVPHELNVTAALATLQARMGRPEARATLDRAWELVRVMPWPQSHERAGLATAEYLWLTADHDPDTATLREHLESVPLHRQRPRGSLVFWLWELGELPEIPDRIAEPYRLLLSGRPTEAAAFWGEKGYPYEQALALVHGNQAEQVEALRILEDLGATATAAKVRHMLRDAGVRIPRRRAPATRSHPAGLTARQAEVLELLARGLSNSEIADRLFISGRTVENHVAAILTKLGATSRREAVDAAREQSLLTDT